MKKVLVVAVALAVALIVSIACLQRDLSPSIAMPDDASRARQPVRAGDDLGDSTASTELTTRRQPIEKPAADNTQIAETPLPVLVDADGTPLNDVAYWLGERPHRLHAGRPPDDAPHTAEDGSFDPESELLGSGGYLWFEVRADLSLVVSRDRVEAGGHVHAPRERVVTAEILGLPLDAEWKIQAWPGWIDEDSEIEHAASLVTELTAAGKDPIWIARRVASRSGVHTPARARFRLLDATPVVIYSFAPGWRVEPEIQEAHAPHDVVAQVGERYVVYPFEIVEADGVTRSPIDGRILIAHPSQGASWTDTFEGGAGSVDGSAEATTTDLWLAVLLHDGELFRVRLDDERLVDGQTIRLTRGTGRAPVLRLEADSKLLGDPGTIWVEAQGNMRPASNFAWFTPIPSDDEGLQIGAWLHDGQLVVQTSERDTSVGLVRILTSTGDLSISEGERIVAVDSVDMEPIDPQSLIERFAEPAGSASLVVAHEIGLQEPHGGELAWIRVRTIRFHHVEGFGWRFSTTGILGQHAPLPATIPTRAPRGTQSRLRLRLRGSDWIDLAHPAHTGSLIRGSGPRAAWRSDRVISSSSSPVLLPPDHDSWAHRMVG